MNCTVNSAASEQCGVGRVDNRVDGECRDVALDHLHSCRHVPLQVHCSRKPYSRQPECTPGIVVSRAFGKHGGVRFHPCGHAGLGFAEATARSLAVSVRIARRTRVLGSTGQSNRNRVPGGAPDSRARKHRCEREWQNLSRRHCTTTLCAGRRPGFEYSCIEKD